MRGELEVSVRHRAMSSSQSSKVEVLWSPNKDEDFATYSNELKLYSFKVYVLEGEKNHKFICTELLDVITWIEEVCIVLHMSSSTLCLQS